MSYRTMLLLLWPSACMLMTHFLNFKKKSTENPALCLCLVSELGLLVSYVSMTCRGICNSCAVKCTHSAVKVLFQPLLGTLILCHSVKLCAVIGELEAPSASLINELGGKMVLEKEQSRSILKYTCSSPLNRLSDGIAM